jgi:hypothetical protein
MLSDNPNADSKTPKDAGDHSGATPDRTAYDGLRLFAETTPVLPSVSKEGDKYQPCYLFRGQENWLSRLKGERIEAIKQEVRALVARWLKMQNVCILMGAGASHYVGGFGGEGLYDRAKSLLDSRPSNKTLATLLKFCSDPEKIGTNFESFLSQLSLLVRLASKSDWPLDKLPVDALLKQLGKLQNTEFEDLLLDFARAIAISCNLTLPPSPLLLADAPLTPHETFFAKLVARDPQHGRALLFTTNYDTLPEQAMDRLGIYYCDGFSGTVTRYFNPGAYDLDLHYPGETTEGRVRRFDKFIHIYKLHGSINWRRSSPTAHSPYGILFDPAKLPSHSDVVNAEEKARDSLLTGVFSKRESLAILPTSAKYGETLAMPYAHLFRSIAHALRQPQTVLFVIGYSGWDTHLNQVILDGLTNPGFTCVITNPVPSKWAKTLCNADFSGRVYCFGGEWGKFEFFAKFVMPDLEILKTDLAIARTLRDLKSTRSEETAPGMEPGASIE